MKEQMKEIVFQNSNGTWGHLIKIVNPVIYTIEYEHITGFSLKEEAEKSYREMHIVIALNAYFQMVWKK